jgi:hypothetical protein
MGNGTYSLLWGQDGVKRLVGWVLRVGRFRRNRRMLQLNTDIHHSQRFIPVLDLPDIPPKTPAWSLDAVEIETSTFAGRKHFRVYYSISMLVMSADLAINPKPNHI